MTTQQTGTIRPEKQTLMCLLRTRSAPPPHISVSQCESSAESLPIGVDQVRQLSANSELDRMRVNWA